MSPARQKYPTGHLPLVFDYLEKILIYGVCEDDPDIHIKPS